MISNRLIVKGGKVIKGTGEPAICDATIEIRDGRITKIDKGINNAIHDQTPVVEADGMTILPGLVDMHAHLATRFDAVGRLLLANGVTSVRDVETTREMLSDFQQKTRTRKTVGPRVFSTGPFFDSTPTSECLTVSLMVNPVIIDKAKFARSEVEKSREAGVDVVEVHFNIREEVMRTIISIANGMGLPTVGDFLFSRRAFASDAMDAGVRALDHASGIAQLFCDDLEKVGFFEEWKNANMERALAFAYDLARGGVFLIPTLVWFEMQSKLAQHRTNSIPQFGLLPRQIQKRWVDPQPLFGMERWMKGAESSLEGVGSFLAPFVRYGGKVVTGTDTPHYFVFPGRSVHREMELLVAYGLTPMQAIQAATRNAAELLNVGDIGTIEEGKLADLLIVQGDPLEDIEAIREVRMVIKNGEVYSPQRLLKSTKRSRIERIFRFFR